MAHCNIDAALSPGKSRAGASNFGAARSLPPKDPTVYMDNGVRLNVPLQSRDISPWVVRMESGWMSR